MSSMYTELIRPVSYLGDNQIRDNASGAHEEVKNLIAIEKVLKF